MGFKLAMLGLQRLSFSALADQTRLSVFEPLTLLAAAHVFPPVRGGVRMGLVTAPKQA